MRVASLVLLLCLLALAGPADAVTVTLAWDYTQGRTPATTFVVARQTGCVGPFVPLATVSVPTHTYDDPSVVLAGLYCYQVTAVSREGWESTPSNVLTFQVPAAPAPPGNLRGTVMP